MTEITPCPACGQRNRVPAAAAGKPVCASCGAALAWIVEATDATFDDTVATGLPVLVDREDHDVCPAVPMLDVVRSHAAGGPSTGRLGHLRGRRRHTAGAAG